MNGSSGQRGLTLMELLFALVSMALIGAALTSVMVASSRAWATRNDFHEQISGTRIADNYLNGAIRQARCIIGTAASEGGRYEDLWFWADDQQFPGQVNLSELRLVRYDNQQKTLTLYAANLTDSQKGSQATNPAYQPDSLTGADFPQAFIGTNAVEPYVLAEQVNGCSFTLRDARVGNNQHVEIAMKLASPDGVEDRLNVISCSPRVVDTTVDLGQGAGVGAGGGMAAPGSDDGDAGGSKGKQKGKKDKGKKEKDKKDQGKADKKHEDNGHHYGQYKDKDKDKDDKDDKDNKSKKDKDDDEKGKDKGGKSQGRSPRPPAASPWR